MYLKYIRKKDIDFNKKIELRGEKKNYDLTNKNLKVILGGNFFYYNSGNLKNIFFHQNPEKQLKNLVKKYDIKNFIDNIEGNYWGVEIDHRNKSLTIFGDKLKRLSLYYFYNDDIFIISDNPKEIMNEVGKLEYDENSLISAFLFCLPKGHSLFKELYRLKYNEVIEITEDKIKIETLQGKEKDTKIAEYSEKDLDEHDKILEKAILSRASRKLNVVFCSGGWDSSTILAILTKHLGKEKVISITEKIILADGRCLNIYELNKAKKIAKILGVKSEIVTINYQKDKLRDAVKYNLFLNGLFTYAPLNCNKPINYIKEKYGDDVVVFNGDGSDSFQNFGFSQYETLLHEDGNFRAYADKMKNYLFGSTFFKKIKNNTFLEDTVYKIFLNLNQDKEFVNAKSSKDRIYYYLVSFILSDIRVPFRKFSCKKYVKDRAFRNFEKWLKRNYFQEAIDNINETNLYYWFLCLYNNFHLQSPQFRIFRERFKNARFPFLDLNLFKFMSKMPENFGRGLEFRSTKYPLRRLTKKVLTKEQIKIIEAKPHSYIYEVEDMNVFNEYLLKGSVSESIKDSIDTRKCRKIFSNKYFKTEKIEALVKEFKQGKLKNVSESEAKLLIILALA